ncbi:hypothetical protein VP01_3455g3 [Puccinia sorghi]|uniref:GBD/FH3 domain-containing protein n=1 Tax=Puccinia sorghi TaxID=27349 RepID=A0A0L6UY11_9BASI|nr:hypothetical protein VP01_3455g3 [Puccinia sorghi]
MFTRHHKKHRHSTSINNTDSSLSRPPSPLLNPDQRLYITQEDLINNHRQHKKNSAELSTKRTSILSAKQRNDSISILSEPTSNSFDLMSPPLNTNSIHRSNSLINGNQPNFQHRWPRADPNNDKFELVRPRDDLAEQVVNEMFDDMMNRRELASLPASAQQDMLNFSIDKKWTLIYNDRYTEWHTARQKRFNSDSTPTKRSLEPSPSLGQPSGSSGSHSSSKLTKTAGHGMWRQSGASTGRGKHKINAPGIIRKESDLITEYETLKCLKILLNSKQGANDAVSHPESIYQILFSLVSPHLPTRKTVADILTFLCHWEKPRGHSHVLKGLDQLANMRTTAGKTIGETMARFDAWFGSFEQVIDGRGKMGSLVGASEELRSLRGHSATPSLLNQHAENAASMISTSSPMGLDGALNEYALANLFLITSIISIPEDVTVRVHLRSQMNSSGLKRIMDKLRKFQHNSIERQLNQIEVEAIQDEEEMLENFNHRLLTDMTNPQQLFDTLLDTLEGSRAKEFFISILQHFLLIKEDAEGQLRFYQLIDQLVTSVVLDSKALDDGGGGDFSSMLGVSVAAVMSKFADQDQLQSTMAELQEAKRQADRLKRDKNTLEEELMANQDSKVLELKQTNEQIERALNISRTATDALQSRIAEMEKQHRSQLTQQDLQIRELFTMLKESKNLDVVQDDTGILDRRELMDIMNKKLQREKAILTLEGRSQTGENGETRKGSKKGWTRGRKNSGEEEDSDNRPNDRRLGPPTRDQVKVAYKPTHKTKDSIDKSRFEDPDSDDEQSLLETRHKDPGLSPISEATSPRHSTRRITPKSSQNLATRARSEDTDGDYLQTSPSSPGVTDILRNYGGYTSSQSTMKPPRPLIPSQIGRKPALYLGELKMHQLRSASGSTMNRRR